MVGKWLRLIKWLGLAFEVRKTFIRDNRRTSALQNLSLSVDDRLVVWRCEAIWSLQLISLSLQQ